MLECEISTEQQEEQRVSSGERQTRLVRLRAAYLLYLRLAYTPDLSVPQTSLYPDVSIPQASLHLRPSVLQVSIGLVWLREAPTFSFKPFWKHLHRLARKFVT